MHSPAARPAGQPWKAATSWRDLEWGTEPLVQSHWYEALIALLLGRAAQAERLIDAVAAEARALGHTSTLATCLGHVGYFYAISRQFDRLRTSSSDAPSW